MNKSELVWLYATLKIIGYHEVKSLLNYKSMALPNISSFTKQLSVPEGRHSSQFH